MHPDRRSTVSAVLIVKDEAASIARCLESVAWADEIVVYDTGSGDGTQEIARRFTPHVVDGYWDDDFGAARNRALAHATKTWVLAIDADEVFEGDPDRMREHLTRTDVDLWTVLQRSVMDDRGLPLQGSTESDQAISRVVRRATHHWVGVVHEQPKPVDPRRPETAAALTGVVLRHDGYLAAALVGRDKAVRNTTLARRQLERVLADGGERGALESARVELARSLSISGDLDGALALAREVLVDVCSVRHAIVLVRALAGPLAAAGRHDESGEMIDAWLRLDPNPAFALAARARSAALRGDAAAAVAALDRIPTTTVNAYGEHLERISLVGVEIWARATLGDLRQATRVAQDAVRRGTAPGAPAGLVLLLGEDHVRRVLDAVEDTMWREYVTSCVMDATPPGRTFLRLMAEQRPGDPAVLAGAAVLAPTLALDEAAWWAAEMRRSGAVEQCPLIAIATDERHDPRQRAIAGALAFSAYGDERGMTGLAAALELVDPADEPELAAELAVVAPGLVSASA